MNGCPRQAGRADGPRPARGDLSRPARGLGRLLLALVLVGWSSVSSAQGRPVPLLHGEQEISLSGWMEWYHDPRGQATVEQVAAAGRFEHLPGPLVVGFAGGAAWLRFTVVREEEARRTWWLHVNRAPLDEVTLYTPQPGGGWSRDEQGDQLPWATREVSYRSPVFLVEPEAGQATTYYLRIASDSSMNAALRLVRPASFLQEATDEMFLLGGFALASLFAVLLNLVHWVALRERLFLLYATYLFTESGFMLYREGVYHALSRPRQGFDADPLGAFFLFCFLGLILLLFRDLVRLRGSMPRVDRLYAWLGYGIITLGVVLVPLEVYGRVKETLFYLLATFMLANFGLAAWLALRGQRVGWVYLLAFGPFIVSMLYSVFAALGYYQNVFWSNAPVMGGSLVHMFLMQVLVNGRVYQAKRAYDVARDQSLEAERRATAGLNREVALRTQELREANVQVARALAQEQQASLTLRTFLQTMAHEFRTPLAVIDSTSDLLRLKLGEDAASQPLLARIRRGTVRMANLFDQILTAGRMDEQGLPMRLENIDLGRLADWAREQVEFIAGQPRLQVELAPGLPPVRGDLQLLHMLLGNLLSNAIKYSPADSPLLLRIGREAGHWRMEVIDRGRGIPADEQPRLFERFWRGRGAGNVAGVGLGLPVALRIAELHGGRIDLDSREGEGTRVVVVLPVTGEAAPAEDREARVAGFS